jgi:crotonobetainyl-CoA:carnitine CoA-transferase CaiB-like acyl-CoA transferase
MLVEVQHRTAGTVKMAGIPVKFSVTPGSVRLPPPLLGEHSSAVLESWLGLTQAQTEELKRKKIL